MKLKNLILKNSLLVVMLMLLACGQKEELPWDNGKLQVDATQCYLQHENGKPFFWLGETGWLLPERLNRNEAEFYLENCRQAGYNVVQVQTINGVPAVNAYGQRSMIDGFDFSKINQEGVYGYWDHMDYIIETAESKGIYIGMVCIWGGLVKKGLMDEEQARAYGTFLAERYKDKPNIIWFIGGDIHGDVKPEVWHALAESIKAVDKNHLMTFHPFGRTLSAIWMNNAEWLDFNMFQSGHRRYEQSEPGKEFLPDSTEEDNWRYVEISKTYEPLKPVIDGEPSYEGIPQGLHNPEEPLWQAKDVRRYAYWSVFAGSFGHTYGNNSIMQMHKGGQRPGAYGATMHWVEALKDGGFNQMKHLKNLILSFPFFERIPDQSVIAGENGVRYERLSATRGNDYLLVYNYTSRPMEIDLSKISGAKKVVWWMDPVNGDLSYLGEFENGIQQFNSPKAHAEGNDMVLIAVDAAKKYIDKSWTVLPELK
jgi:hypothetical protein